jgi:hypothetical protein
MKIIRISNETHSAFKNLCIREKKGLTEGTEIIIAGTLKRGTLKEVKKDVFSQIQSLENTFRSWMKQQEKTHLTGIQEDLIILSRRLKDVSTRTENEVLFESGITRLNDTSKASLRKYEELLHGYAERKSRFLKWLKNFLIASSSAVAVYFFTMLVLDYSANSKLAEYDILSAKYEALREYCRYVEQDQNVKILSSFDERWNQLQEQP